jgi:steroid delta-isomerase-like uncharacterized protein
MFAQISTFDIRSAQITHLVRAFEGSLLSAARELDGFLDADLFTRSRLNKGTAIFYWDTEFDARKARESGAFDALWQPLEPYLLGEPETDGYEPNRAVERSRRNLANEETVRRANRAFSEKNMEELLACYAEDMVQYEPFIPEPIAGHDALRRYYEGSFDYFPDETVEIVHLISVGKWVVGQWICRGTQTGEFIGLPPTGRRFEVPECGVYEFAPDGRVQNLWVYVDSGTIAKQLGYDFTAEPAATT